MTKNKNYTREFRTTILKLKKNQGKSKGTEDFNQSRYNMTLMKTA